MKRKLVKKYRQFRDWKRIVWDAERVYNIPFAQRVKYAFKGFTVDECYFYDFKKNDYREYISEYERLRSREINGPYKFILDDKVIFEEVVGKYVRVPENYAWISDGIIYGLHDNGMNNENFIDYLKNYKISVLKWNGRGGGDGTYVITSLDNGKFDVNGEAKTDEQVKNLFSRRGDAILCEYMTQSEFSASLYPYTTNTIRIVCAKKKGQRNAEFITAIQRVGCKDSIPVDNAHVGGLTLEIDENSGALGAGIARYGRLERVRVAYTSHPDSGDAFVGKVIPSWRSIVEQVVDLTNKLPFLNFVAWDILLTDDGFCVIEGNSSSGCGIFQMKRGVRNTKLGDIYRSYNIF